MTDIKKCLEIIENNRIVENNNAGVSVKNINDKKTYKSVMEGLKEKSKKDRTGRNSIRLHKPIFQKVFDSVNLNVDFGNTSKNIDVEIQKLNALNKSIGLNKCKFGRRQHKKDGNKIQGEYDIKLYTDYHKVDNSKSESKKD